MSRSLAFALLLLSSLLALSGCGLPMAAPFAGPGFSDEVGVTHPDAEATVVIGLTNAKVAEGQGAAFQAHVDAVVASLDAQDGFIGSSLRSTLDGTEAWTMTAWTDADAMWAFVGSEAHLAAIADADTVMSSSRFVTVEVAAEDMPLSWDDALQHLNVDGRTY